MNIAILIPTYKRSDRLPALVKNIEQNTSLPYRIVFIIEKEDKASERVIKRLRKDYLFNVKPNTYVSAINHAYRMTKEPVLFCGADDLSFRRGWDLNAAKYFRKYGFIGVTDDWPITRTGLHASHFFVTRKYIEKYSGVLDEKRVIYSSKYEHIQCDIETEQTAMKRGQFVISTGSVVDHNHWYINKATMDETYKRGMECMDRDRLTYERRRNNFEQYLFEELFNGKVYPVNRGTLSIVLPSYNQVKYLKQTVDSLRRNTYHFFELIIVDDNSDPDTVRYIRSLECVRYYNRKQRFITYNWNKGARAATGEYVAFLNNDITLSRHWDVYLMNSLNDKTWIANPYQKDSGYPTPYGKSIRTGSIDVRGACFMLKKETLERIGYFPECMKHWYSDWWLGWIVTNKYKKSVSWIQESLIHHYGSMSSHEFDRRTGKLREVIEQDRLEFQKLTGLDGYLPKSL